MIQNTLPEVPKKLQTECCWSRGAHAQSPVAGTHGVWKFFGRFLLRQSRIKCSQVVLMVRFGPKALNLVRIFSVSYFILGHPVFMIQNTLIVTRWLKSLSFSAFMATVEKIIAYTRLKSMILGQLRIIGERQDHHSFISEQNLG